MADEPVDSPQKRFAHLLPQTLNAPKELATKEINKQMSKTGSIEKKADDVGAGSAFSVGTPNAGGTGSTFYTRPVDYRPELASPERWSLPTDLAKLNHYWRMFYKLDPIAGAVIDVYCEMPLSDFEIIGVGVEGEVKDTLEMMCDEIRFLSLLNNIAVDFLVCGEAIPHLSYDKDKGYWNSYTLHKPEEIEIIDTHLLGIEPFLCLVPSPDELMALRKMLKLAKQLDLPVQGESFLHEILRNRKVTLEPLTVSYIPRQLHAYDNRGTSILSRLWRAFMIEDALANTTIQTAKRHSAPVKVVSMGDIASGYIPGPDQVQALLQALAQAEYDPQAWIFAPPGTKFEAWGTTDRIMGLRQEYDVVERLKLTALGVSKDFLTGASTFASAQASLQVFMSRLLSFRTFLEEAFVNPKLFLPLAKVHNWKMPTKAEVDHHIVSKSDKAYVVPQIRWQKELKTVIDTEALNAYSTIKSDFEMKVSARTVFQAAGLDWEDELRKSLEEDEITSILKMSTEEEENLGGGGGGGLGGGFGGAPVTTPGEEPGGDVGIEETLPEADVAGEANEVTMHASSLKDIPKRFTKRDSFRKDNTFLKGAYIGKTAVVNTLNGQQVSDRLERADRYKLPTKIKGNGKEA